MPRLGRILPVLLPVAVGLAGAWLGMVVAGEDAIEMGPFTVGVRGSFGPGETVVSLPPFGRLDADTHTAPLRIDATLQEVDVRGLAETPADVSTSRLAAVVEREARGAVRGYALRLLGVAAGGALVLALLVHRRDLRRAGIAVATAVLVVGGAETAAWRTYSPEAFSEPTFSGSLELAPQLIGPVRQAGRRIDEFRAELGSIVDGAIRAYTRIEQTAVRGDEIRVLHVSDIHLSPLGIDFALQIAQGFDVDLVVDTGDLTSYGTPVEELILSQIPRFERPYVFVRGNHDSMELQEALADVPNAVVLDGRARTLEGLLLYGLGHPVYTEDSTEEVDHPEFVRRARAAEARIRDDLAELSRDPDVVAVHDARMAEGLTGRVPVVISGHSHSPMAAVRQGTAFLRVGSTGGAGVNVFSDEERGVPLSAQILVFRPGPDPELVAYDRIEQSPFRGNLTVRRHRLDEEALAEAAEQHRREVERIQRLERTPAPATPSPGG